MSVHVDWDNDEHTAILWMFVGRWTWGEYDDALNAINAMLEEVDHKVDFIYDVREMSIVPPDLVTRFKLKYARKPEKANRFIAVGADTNLQLFWNFFTDLPYAKHLKVIFFDSLDVARRFSRGEADST